MTMRTPLKVLIVEDRDSDAELMLLELRHKYRVQATRVENEEQFLRELDTGPDIILADYVLPRFSGLRALEILRSKASEIPFLLVSGEIPEAEAARLMSNGVTDYILKTSLVRLGPAVDKALAERQTVLAKAEAEDLYHQSEARYQALFEQAGEAILVMDAVTSVVLEANPQASLLFGRSLTDIVGKTGTSLFPESMRDRFEQAMAVVRASGVQNEAAASPVSATREALAIERPDGRRADVDLSATIVNVAEDRAVVQAFLRDVTERNELLAQIQAHRDSLEETVLLRTNELSETVRRLEDTVVKLEEASRHKSEFLRHMSHELRTPLNSILGFTDMLASGLCGHLTPEQTSYVHQIDAAGTHLLGMINDLLDLARIDSGAMTLEPSSFRPTLICEDMLRMLAAQANEKRLQLSVEHDPRVGQVHADLKKARQIMLNLLSNALKFTPSGGSIKIRTEKVATDSVRIAVSDTGCGIAPENLPHIFEEFYQANRKRDQALGGVGIGLALTRRLVEMHGGTISVESRPGEGTTFAFTLPMVPQKDDDAAPLTAGSENGRAAEVARLHVLLISDDRDEAELLEAACSAMQFRLTRAASLQEGVSKASVDVPNAVLVEAGGDEEAVLGVPGSLRQDSRFAAVPMVLLTSDPSDYLPQRARSCGFDACLVRPIQPSVALNEVVRLVLRRARQSHMEL